MPAYARYIRRQLIHCKYTPINQYTSPIIEFHLTTDFPTHNMPNPWNYTNKTCVSIPEGLQTPLEMVQNWRKTFGVWKGRPGKAQPEIEGVNNSYQSWLIDPSVTPDVLGEFSSKNLVTGAVRFSFIVAFRRYQVWPNSILWKESYRRNGMGPYHDPGSLVLYHWIPI